MSAKRIGWMPVPRQSEKKKKRKKQKPKTGIGKENWGEKNFLEVGMAFLKDCVSIRYHILSVLHCLQFIFQCPVRPYVLPFLQSSVPLIVGQIQM